MSELRSDSRNMNGDAFFRFCMFYGFLNIGSLILGGIGVYLIVLGLMIAVTRVFVRTPIGLAYFRMLLGFKQPERMLTQPHSRIYKIATTLIRLALLSFYLIASMYLIWAGAKLLLEDGFLNQNLIYMLFFKFK